MSFKGHTESTFFLHYCSIIALIVLEVDHNNCKICYTAKTFDRDVQVDLVVTTIHSMKAEVKHILWGKQKVDGPYTNRYLNTDKERQVIICLVLNACIALKKNKSAWLNTSNKHRNLFSCVILNVSLFN